MVPRPPPQARESSHARRDLPRTPLHRGRRAARPGRRGADGRRRPRRARLRLRLRSLVLPRRVRACAGLDRPRVHRRRRADRVGRARHRRRRSGHRPLPVQRWDVPALPRGLAVELRRRRRLRGRRRHRRRPGRGGASALRGQYPRPRPRLGPLGRDDALAADALRRHVHGPPCGGARRCQAGGVVTVVGDGAVGLSAILAPHASAPAGSSPSAVISPARRSAASSAPPMSSPSVATRRSRRSWS